MLKKNLEMRNLTTKKNAFSKCRGKANANLVDVKLKKLAKVSFNLFANWNGNLTTSYYAIQYSILK